MPNRAAVNDGGGASLVGARTAATFVSKGCGERRWRSVTSRRAHSSYLRIKEVVHVVHTDGVSDCWTSRAHQPVNGPPKLPRCRTYFSVDLCVPESLPFPPTQVPVLMTPYCPCISCYNDVSCRAARSRWLHRRTTFVIKQRVWRTALESNSSQRKLVHDVGDFIVVQSSESIHIQGRPRLWATE